MVYDQATTIYKGLFISLPDHILMYTINNPGPDVAQGRPSAVLAKYIQGDAEALLPDRTLLRRLTECLTVF